MQGLPDAPLRMRVIPRQAPQPSKLSKQAPAAQAGSLEAQSIVQLEAPSAFVFHHANAHESADGQTLMVDSIAYACFPGFFEVRPTARCCCACQDSAGLS